MNFKLSKVALPVAPAEVWAGVPCWGCRAFWSDADMSPVRVGQPVLASSGRSGAGPGRGGGGWSLADTVGWPSQPTQLPFWAGWGAQLQAFTRNRSGYRSIRPSSKPQTGQVGSSRAAAVCTLCSGLELGLCGSPNLPPLTLCLSERGGPLESTSPHTPISAPAFMTPTPWCAVPPVSGVPH